MDYDPKLTLQQARGEYFRANGFGADGGYDATWVDFKLGPFPFPFPNTPSRLRAVRYHDLHHVLTGYATDYPGELEISAWEIAAGCKRFGAAWVLNLGGLTGGLFMIPRRTFRAFLRGTRCDTLYGRDFDPLLSLTVATARGETGTLAAAYPQARVRDVAAFVASAIAGLVVGLLLIVVIVPLLPLALIGLNLQRRRSLTPRAERPQEP